MKNVTYSHAAPYIRGRLVVAVHTGRTAKLKRDQNAAMSQAYGFAQALSIMARSGDQSPIEGIDGLVYLPQGAIEMTREYLGTDADLVLGTTPAPVVAREDLPAPVVPQIPVYR